MSKKTENILGLSVTPDAGLALVNRPAVYDQTGAPSADKRRFVDDTPRQLAAIEMEKRKTIYAISQITEIDRHAQTAFDQTVDFLLTARQQAKDTDSQPYVEEFSQYLTQMMAQQIFGVIKIGAVTIAEEVAASPYYQTELPEPKGFWARLFGH